MTRTVLLGDICEVKIGRTPPRKETEWFSPKNGEKWVSIKDMGNSGKYLVNTSEYLTHDAVVKFRVPRIYAGTLMMSFKLTVGRLNFAEVDMFSNEAIAQLPIKDKRAVDKQWLYYYLSNFDFNSLSSTSSIATAVNTQSVKKIPVILPDIETQKKIADVLGAIDEKIVLNRKMNETLEQMGQALFKKYFITNPDAVGWGRVAIGKKIHPKRGKSLQSRDMKEGLVPVVSGGLQPAGNHNASNTIPPVITVSASGANAGFVALWEQPVWSADSCFIDATITDNVYFYYLFMKSRQDVIYGMQTGSGQPHIYPKHIELLEVPDAPDKIFRDFRNIVEPFFKIIYENKIEIVTLTALRASLLPRLISGKLKL